MIARRERFSFAAGDLGFNFVWQSIELYLLFFYISVLGLAPSAAAAIFLAGALIDWVADPAIGILIDRTSSRLSLRAWVIIGGPMASAALIIAFAQPDLSEGWAFGYALAAHLLLRACYSLGNIPYGALTARISPDPLDHVALTGARMQGAALGGLIAAAIYALLPTRPGSDSADFMLGAVLLAILAQPAFLITFFGVRERVPPGRSAVGSPIAQLGEFVLLMQTSPAVRRLMAAILAAGLSMTVIHKSILFLFQELGATDTGYAAALIPPLSLLFTAPLWVWLAARIGRVPTLVWGVTLNLVAALALPLVGANINGAIVAVTIAAIAGSGMSVMFWALVPDVISIVETEHDGESCAARIYALAGIARKLAQALAPQLVTLALAISAGQSVAYGFVIAAILTFVVIAAYRPRDHGDAAIQARAPA
jgi:glycoside/pentoside/hexuronide:cation symporter, GPH family